MKLRQKPLQHILIEWRTAAIDLLGVGELVVGRQVGGCEGDDGEADALEDCGSYRKA
jgi:hypothetical protein